MSENQPGPSNETRQTRKAKANGIAKLCEAIKI